MVQPEEILKRLRTRPFQPFRVVLKDGRHYDVFDFNNKIVYTWAFSIGITSGNSSDAVADHVELVELDEIDRLEFVLASSQKAS